MDWDTDINTTVLLPCPFCGGKAEQEEDNGLESEVFCLNCNCSIYRCEDTTHNYIEECRKLWNSRSNNG